MGNSGGKILRELVGRKESDENEFLVESSVPRTPRSARNELPRGDIYLALAKLFTAWHMLPWLCLVLDVEGREIREVEAGLPPSPRLASRLEEFMAKSAESAPLPEKNTLHLDVDLENGAFMQIPSANQVEKIVFAHRPISLRGPQPVDMGTKNKITLEGTDVFCTDGKSAKNTLKLEETDVFCTDGKSAKNTLKLEVPDAALYRKNGTGESNCIVSSIRAWEKDGFLFLTWTWHPGHSEAPLFLRAGRGRILGRVSRILPPA